MRGPLIIVVWWRRNECTYIQSCLTIPKEEGNVVDTVEVAQINNPGVVEWA